MCSNNGILYSNKSEQWKYYHIGEFHKHNIEWKNLYVREYMLYDSIYMKFKKKLKCLVMQD